MCAYPNFQTQQSLIELYLLLFLACAITSLIGSVPHHLHKLVEVNLAVAVLVDLGDGRVELRLGVHAAEFFAGEQLEKLV